jgi:DNA-binding transcriptional LysR family regulator
MGHNAAHDVAASDIEVALYPCNKCVDFLAAGHENNEAPRQSLRVHLVEVMGGLGGEPNGVGSPRHMTVMHGHEDNLYSCRRHNTLRSLDRPREARMQLLPQRGVPLAERLTQSSGATTPDWESVRIFLEVVRAGSFRSASERLGQSVNVLRRRIDELEHQMNAMLITRHVDGVRTTVEGEQIFAAAEQMESASFNLLRARDRAMPALSGEVRIAVTEGLGTFWLAPRLVQFQRSYPRLLIDLTCAMRSVDVLRLEAEAAVQLTKPTAPDLKVVRLGRLHAMLFAGQSYLERFGRPKTREELLKHRLVLQAADQVASQEAYNKVFPNVPQAGFVGIRTNVSSAHYWTIAKGAGIGWLPTYSYAIGGRVVPIDIDSDFRFSFDIWLAYHPDVNRIPRIRKTIDWIIQSFDAKAFPWFGDDFVHPDDLPTEHNGAPLVNQFEGFVGASEPR